MAFTKTLSVILITLVFIGSIAQVQGNEKLYIDNGKGAITVSDSKSTIKSVAKKMELNHYEITLAPGQSFQLKAHIKSEAKETAANNKLVWKTSNSAFVQVSGQGYIKAIKPSSKAVITVSSADKKINASCKVTVMSAQEATSCVAIINNLKVSNQEYTLFSKHNMGQFLANISNNTTSQNYNWATKIQSITAKDQVKKITLDNIQEIKIQLLKAKEAGIKLDANDLKNIEDIISRRIYESGSSEVAEKAINTAYGVSLSEYKKVYTDLVLTQKYINAEYRKVTISDSEVKKYYNNHNTDYANVTVTHILLSTLDNNGVTLSADKKAEAKKKADELLARINAGEDIKALAEKNSDDPGVRENKGEYTFGKGMMVREFEDWAFSQSVGETGIVETVYGYHVMKLEKIAQTPYDDVKESIKSSLVSSKFTEDFTKRMDNWKKESQYEIVINKKTIEKVDKSLYGI